jgi:hypothetical protein
MEHVLQCRARRDIRLRIGLMFFPRHALMTVQRDYPAREGTSMRLKTAAERKRITHIDGYRLSGCTTLPYLGIALRNIEFRQYDDRPGVWFVEATANIGTIDGYTIVVTLDQALEADFIERA